jgi:hypothetical protein
MATEPRRSLLERSGLTLRHFSACCAAWSIAAYVYLYVMLDVFSNDNAFSEAQFKALKCRPTFPARFGFPLPTRTPSPSLTSIAVRS